LPGFFRGDYPLEAKTQLVGGYKGIQWSGATALTRQAAKMVDAALDRLLARFDADGAGGGSGGVGFQVATAPDLAQRKWTVIQSATYKQVRLLPGNLIAFYGPPGAGKSTMMLQLINGLPGPVVLVSAEERLGPAVGERLARCGVTRKDFHVVGAAEIADVSRFAKRVGAVALAIDSLNVTPLRADDLRGLQEQAGVPLLFVTLQVTKAGLPAGGNDTLHEADAVFAVENGAGEGERYDGRWLLEKSRMQPTGLRGKV